MFGGSAFAATPFSVAGAGAVFNSAFSDAATAADLESSSTVDFTSVFSEAAVSSDVMVVVPSIFSADAQDQAQISDAPFANADFVAATPELVEASSTESALVDFVVSVDDQAASADQTGVTAAFASVASETVIVQDTPFALADFPVSFADAAVANDIHGATITYNVFLSDGAAGSEVVELRVAWAVSTSETATVTVTSAVAPSVFNAPVVATVSATDTVLAVAAFFVTMTDGSVAVDRVVARLLWETINDSQNANWTQVNDAQDPGWTTTNNAQPTSWSVINTQL